MANTLGSVFTVFDPLVQLLGRAGRPGGVVALVIGAALAYLGVELFLHAVEGAWWPIMLGLSAVGVVFIALGLGVLLGAQAAIDRAVAESNDIPEFHARPDAAAAAQAAPLPFWTCGDCRIVEPGVALVDRCAQCGRVGNFVQATTEAERRTAITSLGAGPARP